MNLRKNAITALVFLSLVSLSAPVRAQVPVNPSEESQATVTLDFKDADINTVLRVMSLKSGMNIVAGPEVQGTVTIRLEEVPWKKALEVVLRTYGYVYEKDGNIIRVTTRENLAAEPLVTKTFVLNYSKATEIQEAVRDMLTERGRIKVADRMNMLVITDIPTNVYTVEEVVKKLDSVTPQAYIDSKVIKTDVGAAENLGIEWKTGGDTSTQIAKLSGASRPTTFPFATSTAGNTETLGTFLRQFLPLTAGATGTDAQNTADTRAFPLAGFTVSNDNYALGTLDFSGFSSILQMLKTRTNTKVVSNPRIVVLNNQTANIQVGSDIPLPTFERNETTGSIEISGFSFREVGVVLNVTPHINSQREILVDLAPEISAQGASLSFGSFSIPSFTVTKAITQVLIESGQTIAIGGLLTDSTSTSESEVPFLASIPVVGKIFRAKRQTAGDANKKVETLFFVTVTMVDTEGQVVEPEDETLVQTMAGVNPPSMNSTDASSQAAGSEAAVTMDASDASGSSISDQSQVTENTQAPAQAAA